MKTTFVASMFLAAALSTGFAAESLTQKTTQSLERAGDKVKEIGSSAVTTTKNGFNKAVEAVTPDSDARKVDVNLEKSGMAIPRKLHSGKTAFIVRNTSKETRGFEIKGEGMDKKFMMSLSPNETKVMHVDLKPGSYKALSPENGTSGFKADLTVQ